MKFNVSKADGELIHAIVDRAMAMRSVRSITTDKFSLVMDVTACHANGCPLRLADLLAADDFNFVHDVIGIYGAIDRDSGVLAGVFSPRFRARSAA